MEGPDGSVLKFQIWDTAGQEKLSRGEGRFKKSRDSRGLGFVILGFGELGLKGSRLSRFGLRYSRSEGFVILGLGFWRARFKKGRDSRGCGFRYSWSGVLESSV
jgi:hypothetical protein